MTKIITIIIIVSTVWSVISGIIEKHKKEKLAAQRDGAGKSATRFQAPQQQIRVSTQPQTPAELFDARLNALRQRPPKSVVVPTPDLVVKKQSPQSKRIKQIAPLHKKHCPLPPSESTSPSESRARAISKLFSRQSGIRTAVIVSEVLGKPVSRR